MICAQKTLCPQLSCLLTTLKNLCIHKTDMGQCEAGDKKHFVGYSLPPAVSLGRTISKFQRGVRMI